jgi:hypothetical protein
MSIGIGSNAIGYPRSLADSTFVSFDIFNSEAIQYRNVPPSGVAAEDINKLLILKYNDSVWFKDSDNVSTLLAGSGTVVDTNVTIDSSGTVVSLGSFPSAGQYRVRFDNFISSNYTGAGTGGFGINRDSSNFSPGLFPNVTFANADESFLTSAGVSISDEGETILNISQDYDSWPSPENIYAEFLVTVDDAFEWSGYSFIDLYESVSFRVTITPELYPINVTLVSDEQPTTFGYFPEAGEYRIRFENFISSSYDANGTNDTFGLYRSPSTGVFSDIVFSERDESFITDNPPNVTFDENGQVLFNITSDYFDWPAPGYSLAGFLVTVDTAFLWQGFSAVKDTSAGMEVSLKVTITPEPYDPPTPPSYELTSSLFQDYYDQPTEGSTVTVEPGNYIVTINTFNFITTLYSTNHYIHLKYTTGDAVFSIVDDNTDSTNDNTGSLLYLEPGGPSSEYADIALVDPDYNYGADQIGTILLNVTSATDFYFSAILPTASDSVTITAYFDPIT